MIGGDGDAFDNVDERSVAEFPPLYALQEEALEAWRGASWRGIVEAVTGSGKTRIGVEAIREAMEDGRKSLVLVPRRELQEQWYNQISLLLDTSVTVGLRGNGYSQSLNDCDVLISVVNSARETLKVPKGALLIADECHNYASGKNLRALKQDFDRRLGLTATLERTDGKHVSLVEYFGEICFRIDYIQALTDGIISPFSIALIGFPMNSEDLTRYEEADREVARCFAVLVASGRVDTTSFALMMRDVEAMSRGPYEIRIAAQRFQHALRERRQVLAESTTKIAGIEELAGTIRLARRTLVFTGTIDAAQDVAERLCRRGIPSAAVHSELPAVERVNRIGWFREDRLKALVAPMLLDEGVDVPEADLAIIVSAGASRRRMIQRLGRVLRRKEGRTARLAVLYLQETVEDPTRGAHEGFLQEVLDVADDLAMFRGDQLREANVFLSCLEPLAELRAPRLVGEASRPPVWSAHSQQDVPVRVALGLP